MKILRRIVITSLNISKSLNDIIHQDKIDDKYGNKIKNLYSFSTLYRPIKAGYLTLNTKKTFNFLQNTFIETYINYYFGLKGHICININRSSYVIDRV